MDELDGLRKRYDEAASWALIAEPEISHDIRWTVGKQNVRAVYGTKKDIEVVVSFEPLKVVLLRKGKEQVVLNGKGLLHMEHFRTKSGSEETQPADVPEEGLDTDDETQKVIKVKTAAWFEGDSEDGWWDETFLQWTDTKPKGDTRTHL
jgi:alpha 1,3-glucosidase